MSIAEKELGERRAVVAPRVLVGQSADHAWLVEHVEMKLGRAATKLYKTAFEDSADEGRLVDRVEMMLRRGIGGEFNLFGAAGCGKSTAIAELARAFADEDRLKLVDEGQVVKPETRRTKLTIFATGKRALVSSAMELAPWRRDEWIEYLLARWRGRCTSVMGRVL